MQSWVCAVCMLSFNKCLVNVCLFKSFISRINYGISLNFGIMGWSLWGVGRITFGTSTVTHTLHDFKVSFCTYKSNSHPSLLEGRLELSHFSQVWPMRQKKNGRLNLINPSATVGI
jgi:hypothetical protein